MTETEKAIRFFQTALLTVQERDGLIQVGLSLGTIYTILDALRKAHARSAKTVKTQTASVSNPNCEDVSEEA